MTIHNHVILSKAKDLKVSVTVTGPTDCEILRYAQDDKPSHSSSLRGGWQSTAERDERDKRDVRDKREEREEREERDERDIRNKRDEKERDRQEERKG